MSLHRHVTIVSQSTICAAFNHALLHQRAERQARCTRMAPLHDTSRLVSAQYTRLYNDLQTMARTAHNIGEQVRSNTNSCEHRMQQLINEAAGLDVLFGPRTVNGASAALQYHKHKCMVCRAK